MQVIWTNRNGGVSKKVGGMSQTEVNKFLEEQEARLEAEFEVEITELNEAHAAEIVLINTTHAEIVEDLNTSYTAEIASINATHAEEVAGLNTTIDGLEAEVEELEAQLETAKPLPEEAFVISGDCSYKFSNGGWDWFIREYGDKVRTEDITNMDRMFQNSKVENIPFELNVNNMIIRMTYCFTQCKNLESIPKINNAKPESTDYIFHSCERLRNIPEDIEDWFDWTNIEKQTGAYAGTRAAMFQYCRSLRSVPIGFLNHANPNSNYSSSYFYSGFGNCTALDELVDLPIPYTATWTTNAFNSAFQSCNRLKNLTFEMPNGQPKVVNWKSQTIQLYGTGCDSSRSCLGKNSGITADKEVKDDVTYQALKNDPDWFTGDPAYSRYNHDSAVATINSLPDTSAYLATAGGTNTILFKKGGYGSATDGGAIDDLTAEEIAVAAAKGWTVSLSN